MQTVDYSTPGSVWIDTTGGATVGSRALARVLMRRKVSCITFPTPEGFQVVDRTVAGCN